MSKFNKIFYIVIAILVLGTGLLSFITLSIGFRVSDVIFKSGKSTENVEFYEPQLKIQFNYPVRDYIEEQDGQNLTDFILIEPSVEFTTTKFGNEINVNFKKNLIANTEYKITIDKNLENIYGDLLNSNFEYKFTTSPNAFSYIYKSDDSSKDEVRTFSLDTQKETSYLELPNIVKFSENKNFVAAVSRDINGFDEIVILNKVNKKLIYAGLQNLNIRNLEFIPRTDKLAFTAFSVKRDGEFTLPASRSEMYVLEDPEKRNVAKVELGEYINDVGDFFFTSDGTGLLVKDLAVAEYFLFNFYDTTDLISIGRQLQSGGFNSNNNKIVFINFDILDGEDTTPFISIFDSSRESNNVKRTDEYNIDPQFFYTSDQIIFSQKSSEFANTKGIFKIVKYDENLEGTDLYTDPEFSFELPKISPDDKFIVFEKYSKDQLKNFENTRSYEFQNKPEFGNLMILDVEGQKIIKEITNSVEVLWHTF